jgi:cytoskeletal protein CcmA (bactofilin family)
MFNPTPSGKADQSPRMQLEALKPAQPLSAQKLSPFKPQLNQTGQATSLLEGKNGDGFVVIGKGTHVVGEVSNCSKMEIEGYLEGTVMAGEVIVHAGGCLKGHVQSERAEVHGTIEGQVQVQDHLDIRSTGEASGELTYGKLSVAPGGKLAGQILNREQNMEQDAPLQPAGPGA